MRDRTRERLAAALQSVADLSLRMVRRLLFPLGRVPSDPSRILVHLVGNVGDIVVALPMLRALRERFPNADICLLTSAGEAGNPGAVDLLTGSPLVDTIVDYRLSEARGREGLQRLVQTARAAAPDLLVLCPPSLGAWRHQVRNLVFTRFVGPRFVVGLRLGTIRWALDAQVRRRGWFPHETYRYLALLDELSVETPVSSVEDLGPLAPDVAEEVDAFVTDTSFVAFCPGGKQVPHRWPVERFGEVAATLAAAGHVIVAVGSHAEGALCRTMLDAVPGGGVNAAGQFDLRGTTELLRRADLVVTNDTGPMHLAALVEVPVVAVFGGAMPPGRWYPLTGRANVLRSEAACALCLDRGEHDHCVRRIGVDTVLDACHDALADGPPDGAPPRCRLRDPLGAGPPRCIEPHGHGWAEVPWPPVPTLDE